MSDLIDRQKAIDVCYRFNGTGRVWILIKAEIERLPSAEPQERKGKWIDVNGDGSLYECDQCHDKSCCKGRFCPNCGARMDSEQILSEADNDTAYGGLMSAT